MFSAVCSEEQPVTADFYKVPRMPSSIVDNLVKSFKSFQHILVADINDLDKVDGIGEVRAEAIKQYLRKMQEQFAFDNLV